MFSLWQLWLTTTNLSYTFPIFETSATASCGSSMYIKTMKYIYIYILHQNVGSRWSLACNTPKISTYLLLKFQVWLGHVMCGSMWVCATQLPILPQLWLQAVPRKAEMQGATSWVGRVDLETKHQVDAKSAKPLQHWNLKGRNFEKSWFQLFQGSAYHQIWKIFYQGLGRVCKDVRKSFPKSQ